MPTSTNASFYQVSGGSDEYAEAVASASASADLARKYAINPEDASFVDAGISRLSALHYAAKAADAAASILGSSGVSTQDLVGVSLKKYGGDPTGVAFSDDAYEAWIASGEPVLRIPNGTWKFGAQHDLIPERAVLGASKFSTVIVSQGDYWLRGRRKSDYSSDIVDDWCKMVVGDLRIRAAKGGLTFEGHEIYLSDLVFDSGLADHWAIDLLNVNEFDIHKITVGKGSAVHEWLGSGLRMRLSRGTQGIGAGNFVNFGDGMVSSLVVKLKGANQIGLMLDPTGYNPVSGTAGATSNTKPVINNVQFNACHVNSGNKPAGSIGVLLKGAARCSFVQFDVENLAVAWKTDSAYGGGNSGSNQYNTWIACAQLNCTDPWVEANQLALRNTFLGASFTGPGGPYAYGNGDPDGTFAAKRSGSDWILPNGLIFSLPGTGALKGQLRMSDYQHFLMVGDLDANPGDGIPKPGMPKNNLPIRTLGFDVTGVNGARIFRPQGWSAGSNQRIEIGNGPGFGFGSDPNFVPIGPLHRVQIHDPLYLTELNVPLPTSYGTDTPGIIVNIGNKTEVIGAGVAEEWQGKGPYTKVTDVFWNVTPDPDVRGNQTTWLPMFNKPGRMRSHLLRSASTYNVDRSWLGKLSEVSSVGGTTLTIVAPDTGGEFFMMRADEASEDTNRYASGWFMLKSALSTVALQGASGVDLFVSGATDPVTTFTMANNSYVLCVYTRKSDTTARVDIVPYGGSGTVTSGGGGGGTDGGEI
jgi:hypothetical protein